MKYSFLVGCLILTLKLIAQNHKYEQALNSIINSNEFKTYTSNTKNYHVSDELVIFSKMGKMFKPQLAINGQNLSNNEILINDKKENK